MRDLGAVHDQEERGEVSTNSLSVAAILSKVYGLGRNTPSSGKSPSRHGFSWSISPRFRKLNEAYPGRPHVLLLPITGAGGIARAAGSSLAGVGGPAIAGLSAGRAEAACRRMRGVPHDRHLSARLEPSKSPRLRSQRERKTLEYIFSHRSVSARLT
jgi:hypothetical protein